ncbi:hypothetical protein [Rikenella microfusus]|uniref:hypothetical protein n=2 Tax=Rikenella microfusus TaxID=28139 RepID=UPI00266F3FCE|nr:hypothetical protein [Rikenella microfusus]
MMRKQLLKGLCGLCALLLVAGCSSKFKPQWQTCELDGLSVEMPFALETYPDSRNELPEPVRKLVVDIQMLFHEEPELLIMGMINSTQYIPAVSGQLSLDGAAENGIAGIKARADQTGTDDIRMETTTIETDGIAGREVSGTMDIDAQKVKFRMRVYVDEARMWIVQFVWGADVSDKVADRIMESISLGQTSAPASAS